jgi:putative transcription antitermination factor YqgF
LRVIGIDYGDVRTGIAVSDPTGTIATGLKTIVTQDLNKLISEIKAVIEEYKAEKIVVGFPRNMNGTLGIRAEKTQSFIDALTKEVRIPVIKWHLFDSFFLLEFYTARTYLLAWRFSGLLPYPENRCRSILGRNHRSVLRPNK